MSALVRIATCLTGLGVIALVPLTAQSDGQQAPPQTLELFAARPTANVIWSKAIGRIESKEARASLAAVVIEDATTAPGLMRGLRIDLAHNIANPVCDWKYTAWRIMCERANAAVYVEERELAADRDSLRHGAANLPSCEQVSQYQSGTASRPESTGLIVCGYVFPDFQAARMAELFAKAIAELKAAPR
jgi:hypothetical protein